MKITITTTIEIDEEYLEKVKSETHEGNSMGEPASEFSDYARFFDDRCIGWTDDPEQNLIFLRNQQNYANDLLKSKGHLFLNEVYDMLGITRSKAGQVVGWIYDEENPIGDNYVDFGIYRVNDSHNSDFVNGHSNTIMLDFNVDGNILELI